VVKGEVLVFARLAAMACAETPSHSRAPGNIWVRPLGLELVLRLGQYGRPSLATAGLLVPFWYQVTQVVLDKICKMVVVVPDKVQRAVKRFMCMSVFIKVLLLQLQLQPHAYTTVWL